MSQETNEKLSVEQSTALLDRLYADRFFHKLASLGFAPQTEEGCIAALQVGAALDTPELTQKAASADPFVLLNDRLQTYLQGQGLVQTKEAQAEQQIINELASHPLVAQAVLTIKAAEAEAAQGGA